jgi:hypothetical protein
MGVLLTFQLSQLECLFVHAREGDTQVPTAMAPSHCHRAELQCLACVSWRAAM